MKDFRFTVHWEDSLETTEEIEATSERQAEEKFLNSLSASERAEVRFVTFH